GPASGRRPPARKPLSCARPRPRCQSRLRCGGVEGAAAPAGYSQSGAGMRR
ncbi:hypothetical protein HMPREF0731_3493, partial [Pseudoroseomonas cervicalis ATCC 49957]